MDEKDRKAEQERALKELNIAIEEEKKEKRAKLFRIPLFTMLTLITIVILFRLLIGIIEINNPFPYEKNRFYEVTLNGKTITVWTEEHNRFPFIPWLIYFNSRNNHTYYGELAHSFKISKEENYQLKIKSYHCYDEHLEKRNQCQPSNNHLKETNQDTNYTLLIQKSVYNRPTEEKDEFWTLTDVYQGPLIEDITPYMKEGAEYHFIITGKYGTVTTRLDFYIDYNKGY